MHRTREELAQGPEQSQAFLVTLLGHAGRQGYDFRIVVPQYLRTHLALNMQDCVERRLLLDPGQTYNQPNEQQLTELEGKLSVMVTAMTQMLASVNGPSELRKVESSTRRANHDPEILDAMYFRAHHGPQNWSDLQMHVRLTYFKAVLGEKMVSGEQRLEHGPQYVVSVMGVSEHVNALLTAFDALELPLRAIDATEFDRSEIYQ